MRKPTFCICENKDADHHEADQHICFRYIDLISKSKISSLQSSSVAVQPGLCRTRSELNQKVGSLMTRLNYLFYWIVICFGQTAIL